MSYESVPEEKKPLDAVKNALEGLALDVEAEIDAADQSQLGPKEMKILSQVLPPHEAVAAGIDKVHLEDALRNFSPDSRNSDE